MIHHRFILEEAREGLKGDLIQLFIGPRQAGKTTILRQLELDVQGAGGATLFLNLEDPEYLELLNHSPKELLNLLPTTKKDKITVFIDEIQYLKDPSRFLKYLYDEQRERIKLVVSGSSAFYIDQRFRDSLAGRKRLYRVLTLSFREFLAFKGHNELSQFNVGQISLPQRDDIIEYYQEYIRFGGYPRVVLATEEKEKIMILEDLAYSYLKKDLYEADIRHEEVFYKLLKLLAHQVGGLMNANELAKTLQVTQTAINHYLLILQKSFHICLIRPFFRNIRKELKKMPKAFFYDLGMRNFFSGKFAPYATREDKGELLENAAFRQLIEHADPIDLHFWRLHDDLEIDFIVGENLAYEVKSCPEHFQKERHKIFFDKYPSIELKLLTMTKQSSRHQGIEVLPVWEV